MSMDLERVALLAARECIRQHVGIDRLSTLLDGYNHAARNLRDRAGLIDAGLDGLELLGGIIEPANHGRFRITPAVFMDGGSAAPHAEVVRLLESLYANGETLTNEEWVKQFLWIHPFGDGNGRTAWIIQQVFNGTLDSPEPLAKFF